MKKKLTVIALTACLVAVIGFATGCGSKQKSALDDGVLQIGTNAEYTPFEYKDKNNKLVGFDVDLGRALAKKMGVKAKWTNTSFDGIFNGLNSGQYECIIAGVSNTDKRQKSFAMSDSYLGNGVVIVSPAGGTQATDIKQLNGKKVGVQLETTADYAAKAFKKDGNKMTLKEFDSMIDAFTALRGGQIDYIMTDEPVANFYVAQQPNTYKVSSSTLSNEPVAVVCRKQDTALRDKINDALKALKKDGTYGKLTKKWFGKDLTRQKINNKIKTYD